RVDRSHDHLLARKMAENTGVSGGLLRDARFFRAVQEQEFGAEQTDPISVRSSGLFGIGYAADVGQQRHSGTVRKTRTASLIYEALVLHFSPGGGQVFMLLADVVGDHSCPGVDEHLGTDVKVMDTLGGHDRGNPQLSGQYRRM